MPATRSTKAFRPTSGLEYLDGRVLLSTLIPAPKAAIIATPSAQLSGTGGTGQQSAMFGTYSAPSYTVNATLTSFSLGKYSYPSWSGYSLKISGTIVETSAGVITGSLNCQPAESVWWHYH